MCITVKIYQLQVSVDLPSVIEKRTKNVKSSIKVTYIPTMFEMFRFDNTQIVSAVYIVIVLIW